MAYKVNSVGFEIVPSSTNLSFVKENASHVLFSNFQHFAGSSLEKKMHCFWDLESFETLEFEEGKLLFEPRKRVRDKMPFKEAHLLLHACFNLQ